MRSTLFWNLHNQYADWEWVHNFHFVLKGPTALHKLHHDGGINSWLFCIRWHTREIVSPGYGFMYCQGPVCLEYVQHFRTYSLNYLRTIATLKDFLSVFVTSFGSTRVSPDKMACEMEMEILQGQPLLLKENCSLHKYRNESFTQQSKLSGTSTRMIYGFCQRQDPLFFSPHGKFPWPDD